jgi:hypothetical protein
MHLRDSKLTFEELVTVFAQIEACLNSYSLTSATFADVDGIEALKPGHYFFDWPITLASYYARA